MTERHLTPSENNWRGQVEELQALLEKIRPQLIDAETKLADRMAMINAFEFKVRSRVEPLVSRLEELQAQIRAFRNQLRRMRENWLYNNGNNDDERPLEGWDFGEDAGAAAEGSYRYMGSRIKSPPQSISQDEQEAVKKLYRQLARRFHPDLASNEEDRAYRTDLMMQINAAYTAGDLERLQQLAQEPDNLHHLEYAHSDQQLAEALMRELVRCQRRLDEIEDELTRLENHRSAQLLHRVEYAETRGRDLLAEMEAELKEQIAQHMVERDVIKQEIDSFDQMEVEAASDIVAETIYDLGLEQAFEDDSYNVVEEWQRKRSRYFDWDDDILDDAD